MVSSSAKIHTREIGQGLAAAIRDSVGSSLGLRVCQYGSVDFLARVGDLSQYLPSVFVRPERTPFQPIEGSGTEFNVAEEFRICYAVASGELLDATGVLDSGISQIVAALSQDIHLPHISILPDQLAYGAPLEVLWAPEENQDFVDRGLQVRVAVARWAVHWLTRRAS